MAQEMKRQLENTVFEIESPGSLVKIKMSGAQEVKEVVIREGFSEKEKSELEKAIKDAYNMAIKHSQKVAAEKMRDITGFNLPGI